MDGCYYHHYTSSDRMWYMPEHPGPYPAPAEPPSLEQLEIAPPRAEPPMCPVTGEVSRIAGMHGILGRDVECTLFGPLYVGALLTQVGSLQKLGEFSGRWRCRYLKSYLGQNRRTPRLSLATT